MIAPPWKVGFWLHLLYVALAFPLGLGYFVFVVTGLTTSVSLIIIWIGVPMLALMLVIIRALARMEQFLLNELTGARLDEPAHPVAAEGSIWNRVKIMTLDPHTYRTGLWLLLRFPLGLGVLIALMTAATFAVVGILDAGLGIISTDANIEISGWNDLPRWLQAVAGVAAVFVFYALVEGLAFLHRLIGSYLLGTPASERIKAIEKQVHETGASLDVAEQLHDSLGHSISVMTMQAGAARMSLQDQDSSAASALEIVEEKGREALAELDR
ncbi:MAG: hypothetical protein GY939_11595, partial [Actinomycetia bacterium]|nr:hypothetical protein [Actinomycetes bacterium]